MNYFQFNINDYLADTAHLSLLEHGIYFRLLSYYYQTEQAIPKITQSVMRRLSIKTKDEAQAFENVLNDFFFECNDGWHHKRCDAEIDMYHEKAKKNAENGKKGGRPTQTKAKENPQITQSVILANPNLSENNPNHKPITNNHKPITNNINTHTLGDDVENFLGGGELDLTQQVDLLVSAVNLEQLNASIKIAGGKPVTLEQVKTQILAFDAHYQNKFLSPAQRLQKLTQWMKKAQAQVTQRQHDKPSDGPPKNNKKTFGKNDHFGYTESEINEYATDKNLSGSHYDVAKLMQERGVIKMVPA